MTAYRVYVLDQRCAQLSHPFALLHENHQQGVRPFLRGISGGTFRTGDRRKTDLKNFGMQTLYDLLGALPKDGADDLRAAFRRAAKRAHPDVNREDRHAGLKFRRIVRANEIFGDAEQRAAHDHLLADARVEQEQAAKHALADKVHKLASDVMALAGVLEGFEAEWGKRIWHGESRHI
jgi:DnaJ-class molecular chaperone